MLSAKDTDTIVAIGTPNGVGAIGIVRVSGPLAMPLLQRVWVNKGNIVDNISTNRFYYGNLIDISTISGGEAIIDEALMVYFRAPHSYTGEDLVEVHGHGNPFLLERILQQFIHAGARLAHPGEFTQRAYLNGKIDLAQAEAVADLISAMSERGQRAAAAQLQGRVSQRIREHLDALTELRAFVEATIDFPEEDIAMIQHAKVAQRIGRLLEELRSLATTYREGRLYREGVRVVLVGRPNAGKSSLLNALLGEERAIVHHQPGTTRDCIEDLVQIDGIHFRLIDTAGLREHDVSEVERIGIQRTLQQARLADLTVLVVDGNLPFDATLREIFSPDDIRQVIIVLNKSDLPRHVQPEDIATVFPDVSFVSVSATRGDGLAAFREGLCRFVRHNPSEGNDECIITSLRHKAALDLAIDCLETAYRTVTDHLSAEFVAEHLRAASESLGSIVGTVTTDDLLSDIFSRFCIGK